jgi:DNA-binding XRE family transcriptional regulator
VFLGERTSSTNPSATILAGGFLLDILSRLNYIFYMGLTINEMIGRNIRAERARNGWTQIETAGKIKVSRLTYVHWEQGVRSPRADELRRLAKMFKVDIGDLIP